jgi:hypothetical protein
MNQRSAVTHIQRNGALLVFPIKNRKEPKSLWSEFFPRKKMRWEWDETHDSGVGDLWVLMKRLSSSNQVVYSKWYQGRATFFSREVFCAMLQVMHPWQTAPLSEAAQTIIEALDMDSPLSTKQLKQLTGLQGRLNEPEYNRALKMLFSRLLVVAYGEVDDGAFPSLAVGSTQVLFEDLWLEARSLKDADRVLNKYLPSGSALRKHFDKNLL